MTDEKLYTRSQAIILGKRDLCERKGHKINTMIQKSFSNKVLVSYYSCENCDVKIRFEYPELPGT